MKTILILLIGLLSVALLPGAIHEYYTFSQQAGEYIPIQGTSLPSLAVDDALSGAIPIGFTFLYGTASYTQVKISSNGWIGLGTAANAPQIMNELVGYWVNWSTIAPLWDDLSLVGGSCQYITEGVEPNRIFKVQFTDAKWIYSANNQFDFQAWLYENGDIEFYYGDTTGAPVSASASIGINMLPHTSENYLSVTPGSPATVSYLTENNMVNVFPGVGVKYVFSVIPTISNDLMAVSISGNLTPTQGSVSNYVVDVQNRGINSQSVYEVLLKTGNTTLASVPGPQIASGATIPVTIPWTPTISGPLSIYGSVVLAGDEQPQNDNTASIELQIQEEGTTMISVGNGEDMESIPINMESRNSLFETIYYASELNIAGAITGISIYNSFVTNIPNKPISIWLGNTALNDLSDNWIPSSHLVQVFSGNVDFPSGNNTIHFQFNNPFIYTGGNLALMISRPWEIITYNTLDRFLCQTVGSTRSRFSFSDDEMLSPSGPPEEDYELSGIFPFTSFYFEPTGPTPQISISPANLHFDTLLAGTDQSQILRTFNMGSGSLGILDITISGSTYFTLSNVPALPLELNALQAMQFSCTYSPESEGTHTATISITDNQTRQTYQIPVDGSCVDLTINTLPYLQNFDTTTPPELPLNWTSLIVPGGLGASVTTEDGGAYSEPNYAMLANHLTSTASVFLISPQISQSINLNDIRIKFFSRGFFTNSSIKVGIMDNPTDHLSFTEIQNFRVFTNWAEYIVSLNTYAGQGRYIAFKHGNGENFEAIHIDDITIEYTPFTDLAAISVSGSVTPTVGLVSNYTVAVHNYGTLSIADYTVKLFKAGDIEIGSVAGTLVEAGSTVGNVISWTPDLEGPTQIYGKVILDIDENPLNDQTPVHHVLVHPSGSMIVTIGNGDEIASIPVNLQFRNSLFETIYLSSELNFTGAINTISFYNTFETGLTGIPVNVWLGTTQINNLEADWIPSTELSQVFAGNMDFPEGQNFVSVNLPQAFIYDASVGNLVMMVERPYSPQYYLSDNYFFSQNLTLNRSRHAFSNDTDLDPMLPPPYAMELSGVFPRTSFSVTPIGMGQLTGTVYGMDNTPLANAIVEIPGLEQTQTDAQGFYQLDNLLGISYLVTASKNGFYAQTISVSVVQDSTVNQDFYLQPMPTVTVSGIVVGNDDPSTGLVNAIVTLSDYATYSANTDDLGQFSIPGVFIDQSYQYTISKPGYQSSSGYIQLESLDYDIGTITLTEIASMPDSVTATLAADPYSVNLGWLAPDPEIGLSGTKSQSIAAANEAPRSDRVLTGYRVFRLLAGQEQNDQYWTLLTPSTITDLSYTDYAIATLPSLMYRWAVKAVYTYDIASNAAFSNPLMHEQQASGTISGVVTTSANQPVGGAIISAGIFSATTYANGYYSMPVTTGTYSVTCSVSGYDPVTNENIVVAQGQTAVCNFILTVDSEDNVAVARTELLGNYPNPFNPHTSISFALKNHQRVRIDIYNVKGQHIRNLIDEPKERGNHAIVWDGKDMNGRPAASGIYFCRMLSQDYSANLRMMLLK